VHAYADWIRTYSSPEFETLARRLEELADRYADLSPRAWSTYRYAMECELSFFEAAWRPQKRGVRHT
jgi:thiaminase/transcriptional activator TenA